MTPSTVVAILDTSVLYGNKSRRSLVEAIQQGLFQGVWSPHIIGELYRVLTIQWIRKNGQGTSELKNLSRSSKAMMDILLAALRLVDTGPREDEKSITLQDVDDFHLVRAARLAQAEYVVSENINDFPPPDQDGRQIYEGSEFVTCQRFLELIGFATTSP